MIKSNLLSISLLIIISINLNLQSFGATIQVPKDYPTIQKAINSAANGDTILVSPGTYVENLKYKGKAIVVKSSGGSGVTAIDGNQAGSVVMFDDISVSGAVLDGFTIKNGSKHKGAGIRCIDASAMIINNTISNNTTSHSGDGGGIYCGNSTAHILNNTIIGNGNHIFNSYSQGGGIACYNSSLTIENNIIADNFCPVGGGVCCDMSSVTIKNNTISGNIAFAGGGIECHSGSSVKITGNIIINNSSVDAPMGGGCGGGIYCLFASPTITNNAILGNRCKGVFTYGGYGGGICCLYSSSPFISNNTISGNLADFGGGGVYCIENSNPLITNSILWDNFAPVGPEIWIDDENSNPSTLTINYSNVQGGQGLIHVAPGCALNWGLGMMDKDPLFIPGPKGFRYLSHVATGQPSDSPCVDAGSDLAGALGMDTLWTRTDSVCDSGVVDMGFHYGLFTYPSLQTDTYRIQETLGGSVQFLLHGDAINANKGYLIFGSVSGTSPGIVFPISEKTLPINWDLFTNFVLSHVNQPMFQAFMGTLDSSGSGTALLNTPPVPGLAGIKLSFAYGLVDGFGTWDFASNPITVKIVP